MTRMKQFHRKREMLSEESKEAAGYCAFLAEQLKPTCSNLDYTTGFYDGLKAYRKLICAAFDLDFDEAVQMPRMQLDEKTK